MSFCFLTAPWFLRQMPIFLCRYLFYILSVCVSLVSFVSLSLSVYYPPEASSPRWSHVAHVLHDHGMERNARLIVICRLCNNKNNIIINNNKERLLLIWFPCYIVSTLSLIYFYLSYRSPFVPIFYNCCLLWLNKNSIWFIFIRWVHSKMKSSEQKSDLRRYIVVAFLLGCIYVVFMIWLINKVDTIC